MALKSYPPPGIMFWGKELGNHLVQLIDPMYGGINTWNATPALGADGYPLSTDHKGYTGINLSTQLLEYWTGEEWISLGTEGAQPTTTNFMMTFSDSQLDEGGQLIIPHSLGVAYPNITLWDSGSKQVIPDEVKAGGPNSALVNLSSFAPLNETWVAFVSV